MSIIKTDLRTRATDEQGNVDLSGNQAFNGVFKLGLILGSNDPHSGQFPTDASCLQDVKYSLEQMIFTCLSGLSGIGALIGMANPEELIKDDFGNIGSAINNLSLLAMEAQDHLETIGFDVRGRNGFLSDPEQTNFHAELHTEALAVQELDGGDYETALYKSAQCLQAVKQAPRRAKK